MAIDLGEKYKKLGTVQQIKDNLNILEVAQGFGFTDYRNEGAGRYRGNCPFRVSKSKNSFIVDTNINLFHDFGGSGSGSVLDLIMLGRGCDISEAIRYGANKLGIKLDPNVSDEDWKKKQEEKKELEIILPEIFNIYQQNLPKGLQAIIKKKRGFSNNTIGGNLIGYSSTEANKEIMRKFNPEALIRTGLFLEGKNKGIYPLYNNRIIYPYFLFGKPVYSIGGKTENTPKKPYEEAKYKKQIVKSERHPKVSEEIKNILFGLDSVQDNNTILILEGVTDTISGLQSGFGCISSITPKVKLEHFEKVTKYLIDKEVIIINDNEKNEVGRTEAISLAKYLFLNDVENVKIGEIPKPEGIDKIDINDYVKDKKDQKKAIQGLLDQSKHIVTFLLDDLSEDHTKKAKGIKDILGLIINKDDILQEGYLRQISGATKTTKNTLQKVLEGLSKDNDKIETQKQIKPEKDILELLEMPELDASYLDLGENNNLWYYGFTLAGKEAIITSEGKILRNTLEKFEDKIIGENQINKLFKYNGYIGDIAPIISKETIKRIYTKDSRNHSIKPKDIYKIVRDKILYYMDFAGNEEIADVLTCWIIATYCYPLFYWFPHILINAPSGSGKSKAGFIITQLSFRGFDLGASAGVSPAQIFRTIEGNRGTLLVDEFEIQEGLASDTQQLVNQVINASPTKDAYVIRTEQINKKWKAWKFPIFCPKIVCNITGINPTSLSRFIGFKWLKSVSNKGKRKPYREKDKKSFIPIREDLHILILEFWKKIKENYEGLDIPKLKNREEDNWLPLYAIARFIDSSEGEKINSEEQLNKYLKNYNELSIDTSDNTEEFFRILEVNVTEEQSYYTPKQISEMTDIYNLLSYLKSPANWVGKKLTLYKIQNNRGGGVKKYLLSKQILKDIIELYYGSEEPKQEGKEEGTEVTTPNNTNNTKQHKQHKTTPKNVVLCGGGVVMPELKGKNPELPENPIIEEETVEDLQEVDGQGQYTKCHKCKYEGILRFYDSKNNWYCNKCEI